MTLSRFSYHRQLLTGALLVTLLALPALSPLWSLTLTQSYDGLHRLHRFIEFDQAVRHGVLFPRWAPDIVYGYGYPLFNFFPYAHYYLPELLHLLGLSFSQAMAAAFLLYTLLAGYGMYLLVYDLFGKAPALLAAVVYVYAPYQLHNSLVRGNLPEQFGVALYPLVLWAFCRLGRRDERRWFVASVLLFAVFLLSHTALDLMFTPVLVFFLAAQRPTRVRRLSLAIALGVGLSAFVLLPIFFEKTWVRLGEQPLALADYHDAFLSPTQLLALPPTAIEHLLHRADYFGLGPVSLMLAWPALLLGWKKLSSGVLRVWLSVTAVLLFLSILLTLPHSVWLWENLLLLPFLFYPWRFLSLASLALSLLAAMTFSLLPPSRWRLTALMLALALVVLASFPLLYTHYYPPELVSEDMADVLAFETRTGLIGASSYAEYLPVWVKQTPASSPLLPAYQAGQPLENIERFDATSLPTGGRVLNARYGFNRVEVTVSSPQPFLARFHTFYFPGWKATVNGQRSDPVPYGPLGLISLDVPAGETQLCLWFGDTPWRTVGKVVSLVSAGMLLVLVLRRDLWASQRAVMLEMETSDRLPVRMRGHVSFLALLALGLLAFKLIYVDRYDSPFRRQGFDGVRVEEAGHALRVPFGDQLILLGYDLSTGVLHPGNKADLILYWSQQQRLTWRPRVVLALVNPATGDALPQAAEWVPQDYPLEFWELDLYTRDVLRLSAPADAPPGRYLLTLGLLDEGTGDSIGETVALTAIKVPLPLQDAQPEHRLDLRLGKEIALVGYDLVKDDMLGLTLIWRCLTSPAGDYTVFVHLLDGSGAIVVQADSQPRGGAYPTSIWSPGEVIPDKFALAIKGLPAGDYGLAVGLYQLATGARLPMIDANGQRLPDDRLILTVSLP